MADVEYATHGGILVQKLFLLAISGGFSPIDTSAFAKGSEGQTRRTRRQSKQPPRFRKAKKLLLENWGDPIQPFISEAPQCLRYSAAVEFPRSAGVGHMCGSCRRRPVRAPRTIVLADDRPGDSRNRSDLAHPARSSR